MPPRFFVPDLDASAEVVALPAEEAAHLGRVLRLRAGADVRVFDGAGGEWRAIVADVRRDAATVRLVEPVRAAPEPSMPITLVVSVLKGDKMDEVVRDAVMMGVQAIEPIESSRTEIAAGAVARSGRTERWHRVAVASAKQCGRAVVPRIAPARPFDVWLHESAADGARLMLVEPTALADARALRDLPKPDRVSLIVGPEGGWRAEEIGLAVGAGVVPVRLGGRTLRADAVPIVALAACQALWEDA